MSAACLEKAEASRDGRKLRRATQSSGECFPRPMPQLRLSHPSITPISEQSRSRHIKSKNGFERTNPRFDSEVVKTKSKIGLTDSYKRVLANILNIKARP
jgi:hypothetical protein